MHDTQDPGNDVTGGKVYGYGTGSCLVPALQRQVGFIRKDQRYLKHQPWHLPFQIRSRIRSQTSIANAILTQSGMT